jgi:hypothetical protein
MLFRHCTQMESPHSRPVMLSKRNQGCTSLVLTGTCAQHGTTGGCGLALFDDQIGIIFISNKFNLKMDHMPKMEGALCMKFKLENMTSN